MTLPTSNNSIYSMTTTRMTSTEVELMGLNSRRAHTALITYGVSPAVKGAVYYPNYITPFNPNFWITATDCTVDVEVKTNPSKNVLAMFDGLSALKQAGGTIASNCGAHVNVDTSDLSLEDMKRLMKIWAVYESTVALLIPRERCNNYYYMKLNQGHYGTSNVATMLRAIDSCGSVHDLKSLTAPGRNVAMNLGHYQEVGNSRIECRMHAGTLNPTKIVNFIKLLCIMVDAAKRFDITPDNIITSREASVLSTADIHRFDDMRKTLFQVPNVTGHCNITADSISAESAPRTVANTDIADTDTRRGRMWRLLDNCGYSPNQVRQRRASMMARILERDLDEDYEYCIAQVSAWRGKRLAQARTTRSERQTNSSDGTTSSYNSSNCPALFESLNKRALNRR